MRTEAEDVVSIPLARRDALNVYLLGDVLVDAGTARAGKRLPALLEGRPVAAHALTHAHPDHAGGSATVAGALGVPVWASAGDAPQVEAGHALAADTWAAPLLRRASSWPPAPVARRLSDGDHIGHGFTVLEVPGHSAGHIAFWREADRTLVCGDVFFNMRLPTLKPELREPPRILTWDPARNRASARRLAALEPALVLFGHGPPLRDPERLRAFTDGFGPEPATAVL
jgi:glyoxylase-like metal-dependent hydrolase (beta-lactamase superfamily II)